MNRRLLRLLTTAVTLALLVPAAVYLPWLVVVAALVMWTATPLWRWLRRPHQDPTRA